MFHNTNSNTLRALQLLNTDSVMTLLVNCEQGLGNKSFATYFTLVLPHVVMPVYHQSGVLGEWLATTITGVWLLTCVHTLMNFQTCLLTKCLATNITNQVLLPSVNPEMCHQWTPARNWFPTNITHETVPTSMQINMQGKRILVSKCFTTCFTLMLLFQYKIRIMCHLMLSEHMFVWVWSTTDIAHILISIVVYVCVALQINVRMETFVTYCTPALVLTQMPPPVQG